MKKAIIYFIGIIILIFLIPIVCTLQTKETSAETNSMNTVVSESIIENNYDYKQYQTVKLLHTENNSIEEIKLDEYLYGVVSAEMPASFNEEALKAQAVVARTYTIYKINNSTKHGDAQICDDSGCCQAWISKEDRMAKWSENERESNWNKIVNAVNSTQGKIITYNNEPINAFFHSNSGGKTEIPINVWGGSGMPYLQVVETSGEENYSQYSSEAVFSKDELKNKMIEKYSDFEIDFNDQSCICILEYTESGRVKTIKIGNKNLSGVEARTIFGLRSANFEVVIEGDNIKFTVKGYGHGIGMSQVGANYLASLNKKYDEIIKYYYTGVEIKTLKN